MQLTYNGTVRYPGCWEAAGVCWVRCYQDPRGQRPCVVIVTPRPGVWGGPEVVVPPATLRSVVCRALAADPETVYWVEHRPADPARRGHPLGTDRYEAVEFIEDDRGRAAAVRRLHRTLTDVERLIGCVLAPVGAAAPA